MSHGHAVRRVVCNRIGNQQKILADDGFLTNIGISLVSNTQGGGILG